MTSPISLAQQQYQQVSHYVTHGESTNSCSAFKQVFQQLIQMTSQSELQAQHLAQQFALGDDTVSLHEVMMESQKSLVYLKASHEVTKRCLSAYQEIWNMHV